MSAAIGVVDRTLYEHQQRAKTLVDAAIADVGRRYQPWLVAQLPAVQALKDAGPDMQRSIVITLLSRASTDVSLVTRVRGLFGGGSIQSPVLVLGALASHRPPFTPGDVVLLLTMATHALHVAIGYDEVLVVGLIAQPVTAAERAAKHGGVHELEGPIRDLAKALGRLQGKPTSQPAKYRARLLALVQPGPVAEADVRVDPRIVSRHDTWGREWSPRIKELRGPRAAMILHCSTADGVTPTQAWRRRAAELAHGEGVAALLRAMLADAPASRSTEAPSHVEYDGRRYEQAGAPVMDANVIILRGAIWAATSVGEAWPDELLTAIGLHFGTSGGRSNETRDERLANSAAAALGSRGTPEAAAGLGRMKARVTNRNVTKQILKALDAAAVSSGLSASELLELAVSAQGLDAHGRREIPVGDHVAVLAVDADEVSVTWRAPNGRVTARPPVALEARKTEVGRVKEQAKELRAALGLERGRVEDLFAEDREWPLADWRARYLEHPLTGVIGRQLIWTVIEGDRRRGVLARDGVLIDVEGSHLEPASDARVRPWHPIDADEDEVAAWRTVLLEQRLRQPFKQAFREVYVRTPAEEQTEIYSNRFAAHILRYPQARALMTARRWGSNFLGPFDGGMNGVAKREFRTQGIRAEFWHDAIEGQEGWDEVQHCSTDQVRFIRMGRVEEVLHIRDVPPIVLSEAMRDVDLFVSVASIGADINWQDGGRDRADRFGDYWNGYSELPLSASASVRRDVLARLIPGLAIADRLELEQRHLVVRGDLRSYRIHLGSGNIYMAPADTYLCIVPARGGASDKVFLPFDDDPTLSVILSKAFLLARDTRIADSSITSQIRRG